MNPLHLLWIIPVSASIGFMFAAILAAGSNADRAMERAYQPGKDGER